MTILSPKARYRTSFFIGAIATTLTCGFALAAERVDATYVARDVYKLIDGRIVLTIGCSAIGPMQDAIINDSEDAITFIDDSEQCDIRAIKMP
jgi:hypothetical protein